MIHFRKPEGFNQKLTIVSCFVERNGYFLLLQRQNWKSEPEKWGPPAGKADAGEERIVAMKRELEEETGICVGEKDFSFWGEAFIRYPGYDFVYCEYIYEVAEKPKVMLNPQEHQKYRRVRPEQALAMDLMPGEDVMVRRRYGV